MAQHRREDSIGIVRIQRELADLEPIFQADMRPSFSAVGGFVHSISHAQIRALQTFSASYINYFRIGGRYSERADRAGRLVVKNWSPCLAEIGGLPDAAIICRDVENIWLTGDAGCRDGTPRAERSDVPPTKILEK